VSWLPIARDDNRAIRARRDDGPMRAILDLLLPPSCAGCGLEGVALCPRCARPLQRRSTEPPGIPVGLDVPLPLGLVQLEWCAAFTGPVRDAIHALKYRGERRLAEPLGAALADRWAHAGRGGDLLVPVPVHRSRLRERGFDQADDIARTCGRRLGLPVSGVLERRHRTVAQHSLGRVERARNLGGAFGVREGQQDQVVGRWIILVDDVSTTGTTLTGCALALLDAGALAVSALTVARER
jgi:ComF family protein